MGRIPDEDVQKVRDSTDIAQLVSESVMLKQKGRLFWGLCPFHSEKTPSFKVDVTTGLWHCFGCGEGGDAFGFLMRRENLDFPDAVRELARRANIEIREEGGMPAGERERLVRACEEAADFFHKQLMSSKGDEASAAREYLAGRRFGSEVAKRFRIGFAPNSRDELVRTLNARGISREDLVKSNLAITDDRGRLKDRFFSRVIFPIADVSGDIVAFGGRVIGEGHPKYLNSQETPIFSKSRILYALDRAKNDIVKTRAAVVVEGYTDVIALHEAGIRNAVATLGTALTAQHVKALARFAERIVYLFDGDEAGKRAAARAIEFLEWQATPESRAGKADLVVAMVPEGLDPADYVEQFGADALGAVVDAAQPLIRFVLDLRLAEHDMASPEGRSAALASAARVLASIRDSMLAHDYVNHVADRLRVDYATVQQAMVRAKPEVPGAREAEPTSPVVELADARLEPQLRTEEELARLLVLAPAMREAARSVLAEDLVTTATWRPVVEAVVESGAAKGKQLWERIGPQVPESAAKVSGWLVDTTAPEAVDSVFRELEARLRGFALARQIAALRSHMDSLDPVKQKVEYDDAFREVVELQRKLKSADRTDREPDKPKGR